MMSMLCCVEGLFDDLFPLQYHNVDDDDDDDDDESAMNGRRKAQYRQSPRWCNSRPGEDHDDSISQASASATRSVVKKEQRIGKQQCENIGSFTAAVTPSSSSAPPEKVLSLDVIPSKPVLGSGMPSTTKKSQLGLSSKALAVTTSSKKLCLPPADSSSGSCAKGKKKRRSIVSAIRAPLKNVTKGLAKVSCKVKKQGKKSAQTNDRQAHSPPYKRMSSRNEVQGISESSSTSQDRNSSDSINEYVGDDAKEIPAELGIDLELDKPHANPPSRSPQVCSPVSLKPTEALLTEDAREPSLHETLSGTNTTLDCAQESALLGTTNSVDDDSVSAFEAWVRGPSLLENEDHCSEVVGLQCSTNTFSASKEENQLNFDSALEKAVRAWVRSPSLVEDEDQCSQSDGLQRSTSVTSLPSLPGSCGVSANDVAVTQDAIRTENAADSALAWGALAALLGTPAPKSVLLDTKKKKRTPVNLWQGDAPEDIDAILLLDEGSALKTLSAEEENRLKFDEALNKTMHRGEDGKKSTPAAFYESYNSSLARLSPKSSQAQDDCSGGRGLGRIDSIDSIPSISSGSASDAGRSQNDDFVLSRVSRDAPATENAADSALAWGALAALMGSPAPTTLLLDMKKLKKRKPVNLWQDDDVDDLDDIISLPEDDDDLPEDGVAAVSDDCSVPSVPSNVLLDDDLIPELGDSYSLTPSYSFALKPNDKEVADSALAWTALTAILGSPAPTSVVRKGFVKERVNLWEDGKPTDTLPEIDDEDSVLDTDECDNTSLLSFELNELGEADEQINIFANDGTEVNGKDSSDSVLAWSALGMVLGTPAPKIVSRKNRKFRVEVAKKLWEDSDVGPCDVSDTIPSIDPDEDEVTRTPSLLPDQPPTIRKWYVEQDPLQDSCDDDTCSLPSLSKVPSLLDSSIDDDEDSSIPSNSCTDFSTPPVREVSSESLADSVLAWSALAALMGSPAPKAISSPKRKKEVRDLWGEECDVSGYGSIDLSELSAGI